MLWISGDTVLYDGVREVADRLDVDTALLHLGGVRFPVSGPLRYTMTAPQAVELCGLMRPRIDDPDPLRGLEALPRRAATRSRPSSPARPRTSATASAGCRSAPPWNSAPEQQKRLDWTDPGASSRPLKARPDPADQCRMPVRARIGSPNKLALAFGVSMAVVLCLVGPRRGGHRARCRQRGARSGDRGRPHEGSPDRRAGGTRRRAAGSKRACPAPQAAVRRAVPPEEADHHDRRPERANALSDFGDSGQRSRER